MISVMAGGRICKALVAGLALYLAAVLFYQLGLMTDLDYLHSGLRSLFAYHLAAEPSGFGDDYLAGYLNAFDHPYLYDWLTRLWLFVGGDLLVFHRALPVACWLTLLSGIAVAAARLGDRLTVLCSLVLASVQPLYLLQIASSMPHAFGFPLMVWAVVALLYGSAYGLALVTVLSGLLYPPIAPLAGLLLAWLVIVDWRILQRAKTGRLRAVILLAVTGLVSVWLVLDAVRGPSELGPPLEPGAKTELYPENSSDGRLSISVKSPLTFVAARTFFQFRDIFGDGRLILLFAYLCVGAYGAYVVLQNRTGAAALVAVVACSAVVSLVILALKPHFFYRFVFYPGYTLLPLLTVVGLQQFCRRILPSPDLAAPASIVLVALLALSFDSFEPKKAGYFWRLDAESRKILDFAAEQPPGTLFAVWPASLNEMELIPYLAQRPLLITIYAHRPSHEKHVLEMRARMNALIDAYLATGEAALRKLYCDWSVAYLVVEKSHFGDESEPLDYAAPFDDRINKIQEIISKEDFLLRNPPASLIALETTDRFVLDLAGPCGQGDSQPLGGG